MFTHPCFWPRYWAINGVLDSLDTQTSIEAPSSSQSDRRFSERHTSIDLSALLTVFGEEGFALEALAEPMPASDVQNLYPKHSEFPRF